MSDAVVRTENVEKVYSPGTHNEVRAVRGISVDIPRAQFVAIIGPSGSGKSTLMHLLGGLDRPTAGDVQIDGQSLSRLSDNAIADLRARKIGFVFQGFNLLSTMTALENVMLAAEYAGLPKKEHRQRSAMLLKEVGLADRMHHKPAELSGGEQQRVAIARSLVNDGVLILADEPTGELDTRNSEAIVEMLRDLQRRKGKTIVMVTHNEHLTRFCDRTITIVDGRVAGGGFALGETPLGGMTNA